VNFRVLVQVVDGEHDGWFGDASNKAVRREELFEPGYEPILGRLVRMLAAQVKLGHAEQRWTWGEADE
jgi:hypothetical protein